MQNTHNVLLLVMHTIFTILVFTILPQIFCSHKNLPSAEITSKNQQRC